jgi:hypothetical protein
MTAGLAIDANAKAWETFGQLASGSGEETSDEQVNLTV